MPFNGLVVNLSVISHYFTAIAKIDLRENKLLIFNRQEYFFFFLKSLDSFI